MNTRGSPENRPHGIDDASFDPRSMVGFMYILIESQIGWHDDPLSYLAVKILFAVKTCSSFRWSCLPLRHHHKSWEL